MIEHRPYDPPRTLVAWTLFWDMHSGGYAKAGDFEKIYIQAPLAEAEDIFRARFGFSPYGVACNCCGDNYSIEEYESLAEASAFHRNVYIGDDGTESVGWRKSHPMLSVEEYAEQPEVLVIYTTEED